MSATGQTYISILEQYALEAVDQPQYLYDISGGYNRLFFYAWIMDRALRGRSWAPSWKRVYKRYYQPHAWPSSTIVSTTVSGGTLIITLPAGVDGRMFLKGSWVDNGIEHDVAYRGHVVDSNQTTVTVAPIPGWSTLASLVTGFTQPGALIRLAARSDQIRGSGNGDIFNVKPREAENMNMVMRVGYKGVGDDARRTIFQPTGDGRELFRIHNSNLMLKQLLSYIESVMLWGKLNTNYVVMNEVYGSFNGIYHTIVDEGGVVGNLTGPLTQAYFESALTTLAERRADKEGPYLVLGGRNVIGTIAGFYNTQIQYTQPTIVSNGQEITIKMDVARVRLPSQIEFQLLVVPQLSDTVLNPRMSNIPGINGSWRSNCLFILDMDPINDAITGERLPALECVSFDGKPFYLGAVRGIRSGLAFDNPEAMRSSVSPLDVNSVIDADEVSILADLSIMFHRGWSSAVIVPKS